LKFLCEIAWKKRHFSEIRLEKSKLFYPDPRPPDLKPDWHHCRHQSTYVLYRHTCMTYEFIYTLTIKRSVYLYVCLGCIGYFKLSNILVIVVECCYLIIIVGLLISLASCTLQCSYKGNSAVPFKATVTTFGKCLQL